MTEHEYLEKLLAAHSLDEDGEEVKSLRKLRKTLEAQMKDAYSGADLTIRYGGSYAKKTMVSDSYDLDLLAYFAHEDGEAGNTLEEIYESVTDVLAEHYHVVPKRSAIRLEVRDSTDYTHIDVVPGRYIDDDKEDVFLHQAEGEKERLKTNPDKHITHVRDSGRRDIIRFVKIWKNLAKIDLPTFILELLVIEILKDRKEDDWGVLLSAFFDTVAKKLDDYAIVDPANENNDLYDVFTLAKQEELTSAAQLALDAYEEGGFEAVFGETLDEETQDDATERRTATGRHPYIQLPLADVQHRKMPSWPPRNTQYYVDITCGATFRDRHRTITSNACVARGTVFRYHARTSVPSPYEVHWQVVNTGTEAQKDNGLRGIFFHARRISGDASADPHINEERAEYVGKHWIECFIVKDAALVARSGPFYVNIWRPTKPRRPQIGRR